MAESQLTGGESARGAVPADIDQILNVRAEHLAAIKGQRGAALLIDFELPTSPDPITPALADTDKFVVVGTYDEAIFGYCVVSIVQLDNGSKLGRLTEFVVDAEIRKSGIGEAMMNSVVTHLQELGCVGVDSQALPGDRDTKNFFESFGLKARLLTVHRSFDSDASN